MLWARISEVKALCSVGVRRERWARRELMFRRMGCESVACLVLSVVVAAPSVVEMLARQDLINEMRDSRVRMALRRVLRLAITVVDPLVSYGRRCMVVR